VKYRIRESRELLTKSKVNEKWFSKMKVKKRNSPMLKFQNDNENISKNVPKK
jgi:hypothetical protein